MAVSSVSSSAAAAPVQTNDQANTETLLEQEFQAAEAQLQADLAAAAKEAQQPGGVDKGLADQIQSLTNELFAPVSTTNPTGGLLAQLAASPNAEDNKMAAAFNTDMANAGAASPLAALEQAAQNTTNPDSVLNYLNNTFSGTTGPAFAQAFADAFNTFDASPFGS